MTRIAPKNQNSKQPEIRQYYFLITGTVMFYPKNVAFGEEGPNVASLPLNAIVKNTHGRITTSGLADAQVALSQALIQKIGEAEPVEIVDVQLGAISKLGHMLPSEFHDLKVQQAPEPSAEDVAPAKVH